MNLNHLQIFHSVALSGSVSGGAQRLHISQSAVSKQLGDFEAALGLMLFDRLPRGVRLTDSRRVLLGYASRLFALEAEAERAVADLKQLSRGRIAIGASRTIGAYLLPRVLAAFRTRYPEVELSLKVDNTQAIENLLMGGEIDIGFSEGIIDQDHLHYKVFEHDELVLIAAPSHAVVARAPLPLAALESLPILMHEVGSGTRAVTEEWLASRDLAIRPAMTLASSEAVKQTVATGIGLALLSSLSIRSEVAAGTLCVVPVKGLRIRRPLYRVLLKGAWPSPALTAFLELLGSEASGF